MVLDAIGNIGILFWTSVAFCGEELDIGLIFRQTHGISALLSGGILPRWFIFQPLIETSISKGTEWEG